MNIDTFLSQVRLYHCITLFNIYAFNFYNLYTRNFINFLLKSINNENEC